MTIVYGLAGFVSVGLFIYLFIAILKPEIFQ